MITLPCMDCGEPVAYLGRRPPRKRCEPCAAVVRATYNAERRVGPVALRCVECGGEFEGRPDRLVCSRRCKDRRYARFHPETLKAKERRKAARRRALP